MVSIYVYLFESNDQMPVNLQLYLKELTKVLTDRLLDELFNRYMDPVINGDYPLSMHTLVKERLPKFTEEQSARLKGSFDFIGMNYYTSYYARNNPVANTINISCTTDSLANLTGKFKGNTFFFFCKMVLQLIFRYIDSIHNFVLFAFSAMRNGKLIGPQVYRK